ncbi:hypothetical protein CR513_13763, partial [Mucuna pruriens]
MGPINHTVFVQVGANIKGKPWRGKFLKVSTVKDLTWLMSSSVIPYMRSSSSSSCTLELGCVWVFGVLLLLEVPERLRLSQSMTLTLERQLGQEAQNSIFCLLSLPTTPSAATEGFSQASMEKLISSHRCSAFASYSSILKFDSGDFDYDITKSDFDFGVCKS